MRIIRVVGLGTETNDPHVFEGVDVDTYEGVVFVAPGAHLRESLAIGVEDVLTEVGEDQVLKVLPTN